MFLVNRVLVSHGKLAVKNLFGSALSSSQVHRVFSQEAASQEGTVSRGDFLLSLNGASLAGLAHGDVLKALHQAQLHKDVLMVIKKGSDQPRPSSRQEPPTANGKGLVSRKTSPLELRGQERKGTQEQHAQGHLRTCRQRRGSLGTEFHHGVNASSVFLLLLPSS